MKGFMTGVFVLFAVMGIGMGYMNFHRRISKLESCTEKTDGTVVDFEIVTSGSSSSKTLYPIVEYYVNEKGYRVTCGTGTNRQKLKVGDNVIIRYNPDKPVQMLIEGYNTKSGIFISVAVMMIGVIIPVFAIRFIWKNL